MALLPSFFLVQIGFAPLPLPYVQALESIRAECSLEQAASLELTFELSRTVFGELDLQLFDIFRPMVPLSVRLGLGSFVPGTLVNGYVRHTRLEQGHEPGSAKLTVTALDATATLMNHVEQPMLHPNMPDSVIAALIFGRYGMIPAVFPTPPSRTVLDTTTAQRKTDIRFLQELAGHHGYECYVQPDPLAGIDTGHFHPPLLTVPPQGVLSIDFGIATNLESFNASYDTLEPTTALAIALDTSTKAPLPALGALSVDPPLGLEPTLARILPLPPVRRPTSRRSANIGELLRQNLSIATRSSRAIRAEGTADGLRFGRILRPGLPVAVRGAGMQHSGHYYVTRVSHEITTDHYRQSFTAWRNAVGVTGAEMFLDPLAALG